MKSYAKAALAAATVAALGLAVSGCASDGGATAVHGQEGALDEAR